jgi:hypothetical protein
MSPMIVVTTQTAASGGTSVNLWLRSGPVGQNQLLNNFVGQGWTWTERFTPSLRHLRRHMSWGNAGEHGAWLSIPDKDEAAGSSPARPTTPGLSRGNARRSAPWIAAVSAWGRAWRPKSASLHCGRTRIGSDLGAPEVRYFTMSEQCSSARALRIGAACPHRRRRAWPVD